MTLLHYKNRLVTFLLRFFMLVWSLVIGVKAAFPFPVTYAGPD